ncbi:MAG TPA: SCO family protein [Bryobacteraceae bacterium]|nr:SCO family protein [Bryobacteraceae bacterium]
MNFSGSIWLSGAVAIAVCASGCNRSRNAERVRRFPISGMVMEQDEIHSRLTIAHAAVSGLMPAMTMPFRIANLNPSVQPGDAVRGTLVVMPDDGWIEGLTVTKKRDASFASPRRVATQAAAGAPPPEFSLVNQDGAELNLQRLRGKIVLMTFIYTRCPFPDYCPRMMKNFKAVRRMIAEDEVLAKQIHFVSVSIDPEHDTPAVLRAYGERVIGGANPFEDWDLATGSPEEIRRLASWFGLTYYRESDQITHSLSTAIIDPEGRLVTVLEGNNWQPAEAAKVLRSIRK